MDEMDKKEERLTLQATARIARAVGRKAIPVMAVDVKTREVRVFPTIMDAMKETGINSGNISEAIKGRRKQVGGYVWARFDSELTYGNGSIKIGTGLPDMSDIGTGLRGRPKADKASLMKICVVNHNERFEKTFTIPLDDGTREKWIETATEYINGIYDGKEKGRKLNYRVYNSQGGE